MAGANLALIAAVLDAVLEQDMTNWSRWAQQASFMMTDVLLTLKVIAVVGVPIAVIAAIILVVYLKRRKKL